MLSIQNNLLAMNADNFFQINSKNRKRTTEKLSSGYRINRAADDAAGLAISEKMRRQIRGLMQGTSNAQEGISFVQVADGSMDEVHSMLQRMNELALKSLNGTCTDSDRAALNAEFNQLRAEIDRINKETQYNEQPVFEEHESSYYQITGNRRWNENQFHTVTVPGNELNIHLPDYYEPSDYTLSVPAGTYTTQELIDEIDTALENMVPANPGFVFEYTDTGLCKLNFERSDGMPTEIASVDGSLSYLLYDSFNGSASSSLMGTTVFDAEYPLTIQTGQNNVLGFYIESVSGSNYISINIPSGDYTRSEMIDTINALLSKESGAAGIVAKEYGDSCIQLTGGDSVSIVGLKGNMFKLDDSSAVVKYSSVFYDNVKYGYSYGGRAAYVWGRAYYNESVTDKIYLSSANYLKVKVNGAEDYTKITFEDEDGGYKAEGYTIEEICEIINGKLKELGLLDEVKASVSNTSVYVQSSPNGSSWYTMQYLTLTSSLIGSSSSLKFDMDDDGVVKTYNALFCDTNYLPYQVEGFTGSAYLTGSFTLDDDAVLTFTVEGDPSTTCTIKDIGGYYKSGSDLVSTLNAKLQGTDLENEIAFQYNSDGTISIKALTDDIQKIYFDDGQGQQNDTYKQLFTRTVSPGTGYSYGTVTQIEGSTEKEVKPASASLTISASGDDITITEDTKEIAIRFTAGQSVTITLATGTYSRTDMVSYIESQIKSQLKLSDNNCFSSVEVGINNNTLTLTATPKKENNAGYYSIYFDDSSPAWEAIYGSTSPTATDARGATMGTRQTFSTATVDGSNDELTLTIDGQNPVTIHIEHGTFDSKDLAKKVQDAFKNTDLENKITVSGTGDRLVFTSSAGSFTAEGSFYDDVIITKESSKVIPQGGTDAVFQDAFIVGRRDLSTETIEIVKGGNDAFTFDFTYPGSGVPKTISVKIEPEGTYTGEEIAAILEKAIQDAFEKDEDLKGCFEISVSIGGETTGVVGANDDTALQIKVTSAKGTSPAAGYYIIDGVRGSAAGYLFYKTTINPNATYITGTKNLSNGVTFKTGQNVLTFCVDSVPYQYTFPEGMNYTAKEFVNLLNDMFENGDDNGNAASLVASIENGVLKIAHKALGSHSITDIGGSARSTLFLEESGRNSRDPIYLLVGAETKDLFEIPRTRVSSCSLAINSVIITKPKYAEKAVNRIKEAITMVSSRRGIYGSVQNRLEHTINNNNNVIENTQASESAIRDADIASESMEYAKNNFLMQASQTILAQANQQPNLVLNLLQH